MLNAKAMLTYIGTHHKDYHNPKELMEEVLEDAVSLWDRAYVPTVLLTSYLGLTLEEYALWKSDPSRFFDGFLPHPSHQDPK